MMTLEIVKSTKKANQNNWPPFNLTHKLEPPEKREYQLRERLHQSDMQASLWAFS